MRQQFFFFQNEIHEENPFRFNFDRSDCGAHCDKNKRKCGVHFFPDFQRIPWLFVYQEIKTVKQTERMKILQ